MPQNPHIRYEEVTIASSAAASGAFNLFGYRIASILKPATWTAADISFETE